MLFIRLAYVKIEYNEEYYYKALDLWTRNVKSNLQRGEIYDRNNNLITVIGLEKRQKVTYDELPEVLIDAIIATEDSKFYQHKGVDLPRFLKVTLLHLQGHSAGGASTITMQLSKNSYTSTEASGIK